MTADTAMDDAVGPRLASADQRSTSQRKTLVDVLAGPGRPLTIPEIPGYEVTGRRLDLHGLRAACR